MTKGRVSYRIDGKIGRALECHLQERLPEEREELAPHISTLSSEIRNIGRISALEVLWAIGRLMQ